MNLRSIYESIISEESHCPETITEDKTSLIKNRLVLPDIEDSEEKEKFKATLIGFFKKHPNYENKIDWNKARTLTRKDFDEVLSLEGSLSGEENAASTEKSILDIFKSVKGRKFKIVGENSRWLFVAPLNWEAAVYCNSSENQGAGAKWCIGQSTEKGYWNEYVLENKSIFVMAFNKSYREMSKKELNRKLKYMIEKDDYDEYYVWSQEDVDKGEDLRIVGENKVVADKMFSKAKKALNEAMKEQKGEANEKAKKILSGLKEIDENTLDDELKHLITEIEIPDSVTSIGDGAFYNFDSLTSVTIPDSVTSIGGSAFSFCSSLTSVTIPDSVTSIRDSAFSECESLVSITIPNSVTSIGNYAFADCDSLTSITIPDSVTTLGEGVFFACNPKIVVTVSKNFDKELLKKTRLPTKAKIRVVNK